MTLLEIGALVLSLMACVLAGWSLVIGRSNARRLKSIFQAGSIEDADALIEAYAERFTGIDAKLDRVFTRLSEHDKLVSHTIQKVSLKRFNPFDDMGGDSSFVLALLDQEDTGVLVTSMMMRDGTRVYAKSIQKGMCSTNLSPEESAILQETIAQYK